MQKAQTNTKSELAQLCCVSIKTIAKWCNVDFYDELKSLGYKKDQQIFTPTQTQFLKQNLLEYSEK